MLTIYINVKTPFGRAYSEAVLRAFSKQNVSECYEARKLIKMHLKVELSHYAYSGKNYFQRFVTCLIQNKTFD